MDYGIIVAPGICGSRLFAKEPFISRLRRYREGDLLWVDSRISKAIDGDIKAGIKTLAFNREGYPLHPTGCISSEEDYGVLGSYRALLEHLTGAFPEAQVVFFSYDWRLGAEENARRLNLLIEERGYRRVSFVAHSMGGLVCSKYIEMECACRIDKFIALGTPFLGAPKALYVLATGRLLSFVPNIILSNTLKSVCGNFPSVYELLPNQRYISCNAPYIKRVTKLWGKDIVHNALSSLHSELIIKDLPFVKNPKMLRQSRALHSSLYSGDRHVALRADSYCICGCGINTVGEVVLEFGRSGRFRSIHSTRQIDGDGTVPLGSASLCGAFPEGKTHFLKNVDHGHLHSDPEALSLITTILS